MFTRRQDGDIGKKDNELMYTHVVHITRVTPTFFKGVNELSRKRSIERRQSKVVGVIFITTPSFLFPSLWQEEKINM